MLGGNAGPPAPRALLIDFDGVLVDSEPLRLQCWNDVFGQNSLPLVTSQDWESYWFSSLSSGRSRNPPKDLAGVFDTAEATRLQYQFRALFRRCLLEAPPRWEIVETLRLWRFEPRPLALVTNMPRAVVDEWLTAKGIANLVPLVVGRQPGCAPKPAPDLYRLAAEQLGVAPETCVALEDSPHGVAAAVSAGMRTVGLADSDAAGRRLNGHLPVIDLRSAETRDMLHELLFGADKRQACRTRSDWVLLHDAQGAVHLVDRSELLRRRAGYVVHLHQGRLLLQGHDANRAWDLPGGGCEQDERPDEAASRELREETGLAAGPLRPWLRFEELFYDIVSGSAWRSQRHFYVLEDPILDNGAAYAPLGLAEQVAPVAAMVANRLGSDSYCHITRGNE